MQSDNGTIIGIFSDITVAKKATDELHSQGIAAARLVENDQAVTFTGTAERESHRGGVRGFFARLFGWSDEREDWKLNSDSETFFQNAYDKKHHLVVIEDCKDREKARAIISRLGGVAEEQGGHHYHSARDSLRFNAAPQDRDQSLDSGRRSAVDHAADSGLGVDVDRMPFAHSIPPSESVAQRGMNVSDRVSQSALSGTADHVPFEGQGFQRQAPDHAAAYDPALGTGVAVPSTPSFAGTVDDEALITRADRRPMDRALDGVSGDADRTPLVGSRSPSDRVPLDKIIVGDDRVHDYGLSNADVSRISSDRIMELSDEDQPLADGTDDDDHILPQGSFPLSRPQGTVPPGP